MDAPAPLLVASPQSPAAFGQSPGGPPTFFGPPPPFLGKSTGHLSRCGAPSAQPVMEPPATSSTPLPSAAPPMETQAGFGKSQTPATAPSSKPTNGMCPSEDESGICTPKDKGASPPKTRGGYRDVAATRNPSSNAPGRGGPRDSLGSSQYDSKTYPRGGYRKGRHASPSY